jgi:hypothetical protein
MEAFFLLFAFVCTAVFALIAARHAGHAATVKRALHEGRRVPIADFPGAEDARIDGRVVSAGSLLEAPISGRDCVAYYVAVKESRGKQGWAVILREQRQRDFIVEDRSGRAFVRVAGAKIAVHKDQHLHTGYLDEPTPAARKLLYRHGEKAEGLIFSRSLRYEEGVIEEGELVAVRGHGDWEPDPNPDPEAYSSYRGQPKRLVLRKPAEGELFISDEPVLFGPPL